MERNGNKVEFLELSIDKRNVSFIEVYEKMILKPESQKNYE
jgi:hypothetical protein